MGPVLLYLHQYFVILTSGALPCHAVLWEVNFICAFSVWKTAYCRVGLGICYDMRFAELAQIYAQRGEAAVHFHRFESGLAFVGRGSPSLENLEERSYSLHPI